MTFPKASQQGGGRVGFQWSSLSIPSSSRLSVVASCFYPSDRVGPLGEDDPPEEGAFRFWGDFQAIKKTGGHPLHAEGFDLELYCVVCGHLDMPHAVDVGWVRVWVVGSAEEAA